eukprot:CAMPEP_0118905778 /NCGR_PEP_ID=MMETSP1166-20130328/9618_1 /TAXON_ID=1104430 /ORGANISM="Chrysoreinhardia sp, Strain CCMP3193" /LENGTH=1220 /DNA_ID=CAMNT_0006845049 /DNA_START=103 /DNA_END=3765 /DNA_ORIENTATION=-
MWNVHKFGGTSVASAECFLGVKEIIEENLMADNVRLGIVVSAMGGKPKVTDLLLSAVAAAAAQDDEKMSEVLEAIRRKHVTALNDLAILQQSTREEIRARIEQDLEDVQNLLRAVGVMRSATPQIAELVSGFGETWSARILTALLRAAGHDFVYVDARDVLRLKGAHHDRCGAVEWTESQQRLDELLGKLADERESEANDAGPSSLAEERQQRGSSPRSSSATDDDDHHGALVDSDDSDDMIRNAPSDEKPPTPPKKKKNGHHHQKKNNQVVLTSCLTTSTTNGHYRKERSSWGAQAQNQNQNRKKKSSRSSAQLVITGYIASTVDGAPTTLKRDGSDYSASIFGKLLSATEVHIWTDVDGVLSADPRRVPEAFSLEEVTYEEAMELAYFGAKVLHPKTMTPAVEANIPLFIRNTFNPRGRGTRIGRATELQRKSMMAGFTTVDDVAVINVCGTGMLGVPGVVFAAAGALKNAEISVRLIAQASSEMSIALAVDAKRASEAKKLLTEAYEKELRSGEIAAVDVVQPCSIIAAVAQSLSNDAPGRFYDALGRCGIPLVAAAQGCDERNLSAVVHQADARRALRAVHSAFLSHNVVAVALVGAGFVGGHLLDAIAEAERMLLARFNVKIRICAIVNADVMALAEPDETLVRKGGEPEIDLADWRCRLKSAATKSDFDGLVGHLLRYRSWCPDIVVVDASYSLAVAEQHATWLQHNFHVVNANTRALAGPLDLFETILLARDAAGPVCYCSESCVGGGLPVIDTLRNLVLGGDTVRHVECVISASMSFIFSLISPASAAVSANGRQDGSDALTPTNGAAAAAAFSRGGGAACPFDEDALGGEAFSGGAFSTSSSSPPMSFKDAVKRAWVMGLLENEPFLDLSGQDAATKLLCLGRELGLALEPQHILNKPVDGLREILTDTTHKPKSTHARLFRRQYVLWRCGSRRDFENGGTDDDAENNNNNNNKDESGGPFASGGSSSSNGGNNGSSSPLLKAALTHRSSSSLLDDEDSESWNTPESHERAMAIAGGNIATAPSPATQMPHRFGVGGGGPNGRHPRLPRLFGWSAVESYDAKSLETGFSRCEQSGRTLPIDEEVLDLIDAAVSARIRDAHARGKVLRHVGRIDVATGDVGIQLEEVSPNHAFAQLTGPELCVRFFTERYRAIPLTVNGPLFAAGMASGVFSELLRVVRHCSGHDRPYHLQLRKTRSMNRLQDQVANLNFTV